jgi:hypothetical protein
MARNKLDGIIEAVRYEPDGKIILVRVYERHGAVWSDRILLGRKELAERLKSGSRFAAGRRTEYLGNVFETGPAVRLEQGSILTAGQAVKHDLLSDVPLF